MPTWWDRYIAAWNRHDAEAMALFLAVDAVYEDLALGERIVGRQAIREWAAGIVDRLSSDYRFETNMFFENDDHYVAQWTMIGTHDRSGPRLAATGKPFRIPGVSVGDKARGLITINRDYWNMLALLAQVGVMAPPRHAAPSD